MNETEFNELVNNTSYNGQVCRLTLTMLTKHYETDHAIKIFDRLQTKEFLDEISYSDFEKIVNLSDEEFQKLIETEKWTQWQDKYKMHVEKFTVRIKKN